MKEITLTQNKIALVDDSDFDFVNQYKWAARKQRNNWYAQRLFTVNGKRVCISMHIFLFDKSESKNKIDHVDQNGLNNQRVNLRECTHAQNMANRRSKTGSSSKYLGVTWNKAKQRWRVFIQKDNNPLFIGQFKNETDAALAYNNKAIELHGEFANLNKLDPSLKITRNGKPYKPVKAT